MKQQQHRCTNNTGIIEDYRTKAQLMTKVEAAIKTNDIATKEKLLSKIKRSL